MAHDVFVSYSHKDKVVADAIVSYLEFKGSRCWYAPRDIVPGADWAASIMDAIRSAKVMVLLFTDYANTSTQVAREVNLAVSNGVTIIPFKMTNSMPTQGMQYYLSTVHWLDAMSSPLDQSIKQLDARVRGFLSGAPVQQMPASMPTIVVEKKRPAWLIPVVAVLGVLALACAILLPRLIGANTGTQGNFQGNYQNDAFAASDGEWFYFRGSDGCLYRMRLDGSERTQLSDERCSSIGVIDGYIYYSTVGSSGYVENICRMRTDGSERTTLYNGMFEEFMIVGGRMYFKNSLDSLKLYSIALDGTDLRCEGSTTGLYYLTIWDGKMYWANDEDGRCLYRANLDGSEATKLTKNGVDSITVCDGWIFYNDLGDHGFHMLDAETLEDRTLIMMGIYDPVVSPYGIVGMSSLESLHLFRSELGVAGGTVLTDYKIDDISVVEGFIFFTNEDDGNVYMMDIYGGNLMKL